MGLRTGPIQEGSQPGPRLDRKARVGKDPKAHSRYMRNQACTGFFFSLLNFRIAIDERGRTALGTERTPQGCLGVKTTQPSSSLHGAKHEDGLLKLRTSSRPPITRLTPNRLYYPL